MVRNARLYARLVGATIHGQMQYRASFVLETLAVFVGSGVDFVALLVFFGRVDTVGGWSMPEVALLYSLVGMSLGVAQVVGAGFEEFDSTIRLGRFDQMLVRPRPAWLQIVGSQLPLRRLGHVAQAVIAFLLAIVWLQPTWGWVQWLFVLWTVLGGALFFLGLFLVRAATCFATVESIEITNIVTYGGREVASYPMHIYGDWMQRVFVYVLPLAFVNYFPTLWLLGKSSSLGEPALAWLAMPLCAAVLGAGALVWRRSVLRYQSTGS